ncbi:MAG TPA: Gfo/Idh/MocA family oxidoreductase [Acidimicrobiales bacterium]|nr:Gfo/Idh/MocA family oxidoreductase [Acidimicrobiales bacterium]
MRFGLVGTGWWARTVHGRALADSPEVELVGVWGRDTARTAAAALELGTRPYDRIEDLVTDVQGLAFAVPPDVQAAIAVGAAQAGRHLLLEKPVATSLEAARRLADAASSSGIATVVFLTLRFRPAIRAWLADCAGRDWSGGAARMFGAAFAPGSPFDTPWRHEKGGLWDVGPHVLSVLVPTLGPVRSVRCAAAGAGDAVHLVLEHDSGATSTASLSIAAAPAAVHTEVALWGPPGCTVMPPAEGSAAAASALALHELVEVASGARQRQPCNVQFGTSIVRVLAEAERQLGRAATS